LPTTLVSVVLPPREGSALAAEDVMSYSLFLSHNHPIIKRYCADDLLIVVVNNDVEMATG